MCFRFLQVAYNFWLTGHLPHHDETQVEGVEIDAPGAGAAGDRPMSAADHLRAARRADADGHADLDCARPDRADVPVLHDHGADRIGGAETVHRHREVRDHGDPVLYSGRQFPHPWRRRAANDRVRANDDRPLGGRPRHRGHDGGRAVLGRLRIVAGDGGRDRFDHAAGDAVGRLSQALCRRRHRHRRRARQSDSAVDHHGDLFGGDERGGLFRSGRREGRLRVGRADCSWPAWCLA